MGEIPQPFKIISEIQSDANAKKHTLDYKLDLIKNILQIIALLVPIVIGFFILFKTGAITSLVEHKIAETELALNLADLELKEAQQIRNLPDQTKRRLYLTVIDKIALPEKGDRYFCRLSYEIENISKKIVTVSFSEFTLYLLPSDMMKNHLKEDWTIVQRPGITDDQEERNKNDGKYKYGWKYIATESFINYDQYNDMIKLERYKNSQQGGGVTGDLKPGEKGIYEMDFYIIAEEGSWIGAREICVFDYSTSEEYYWRRSFDWEPLAIQITDTK